MRHGWSIRVFENPGITGWHVNPHIYFWSDFDADHSSADPYFSSPHTINISFDDSYKAYIRLVILLRMASAARLIVRGRKVIRFINDILYDTEKYFRSIGYSTEDLDVFLEELDNPFDDNIVQEIRNRPIGRQSSGGKLDLQGQIFEEAVCNRTAREILLWLSFSEDDILYFMTNAYKILDSIKTDIRLAKTKTKKNSINFDGIDTAIEKMSNHKRYMNTKSASNMLGRHGMTTHTSPKHNPTLEEIKMDLRKLVLEWFKTVFILNGNPNNYYISQEDYDNLYLKKPEDK